MNESTQNRDAHSTTTRPVEAETFEECSEFGHNRILRHCVQKGEVTNRLMSMTNQEALEQADHSFFAKIVRAKRTIIQDGCTDDGVNDLAKRNEEPPD